MLATQLLTLAGAGLGLLTTPRFTLDPLNEGLRYIKSISISELIAIVFGALLGLVFAALLAVPLSRLPSPFGQFSPVVAAVALAYLGGMLFSIRKKEIGDLLRSSRRSALTLPQPLLENLPLWLDVPEHDTRIVHAGVVPGVPITAQKRRDLLKMRALEHDGTATSSWHKRSWAADYHGPPHVVFGHNAITGLQLHDAATGLDSGCVYGGALSALVLPAEAPVPPPGERTRYIASVPARRRYVDFDPRAAAPAKGSQ